MTNKTTRQVQTKMMGSEANAAIFSESEILLVLAMRSLPAEISKALSATTHSQADYYRQQRRPRFHVINGGQRLSGEARQ